MTIFFFSSCIGPMSSAENQSQLLVNYTDENQGKILRIDFFLILGKYRFSENFQNTDFFYQTLGKNTKIFSSDS